MTNWALLMGSGGEGSPFANKAQGSKTLVTTPPASPLPHDLVYVSNYTIRSWKPSDIAEAEDLVRSCSTQISSGSSLRSDGLAKLKRINGQSLLPQRAHSGVVATCRQPDNSDSIVGLVVACHGSSCSAINGTKSPQTLGQEETRSIPLHTLVIHPSHRRKGLASRCLLKLLREMCPGESFVRMKIKVCPGNEGATAFCQKFHFDKVQRNGLVYSDVEEERGLTQSDPEGHRHSDLGQPLIMQGFVDLESERSAGSTSRIETILSDETHDRQYGLLQSEMPLSFWHPLSSSYQARRTGRSSEEDDSMSEAFATNVKIEDSSMGQDVDGISESDSFLQHQEELRDSVYSLYEKVRAGVRRDAPKSTHSVFIDSKPRSRRQSEEKLGKMTAKTDRDRDRVLSNSPQYQRQHQHVRHLTVPCSEPGNAATVEIPTLRCWGEASIESLDDCDFDL